MRLIPEGSGAFQVGGGVLTPGLELGLRYDCRPAETGTGVEGGGRIDWADAASGLNLEANARARVAYEDSGYGEWGGSGALRLAPGERGRGVSFSLAPTYGAVWTSFGRRATRARSPLPGRLNRRTVWRANTATGSRCLAGLWGRWRGAGALKVNLDATRREFAILDGADAVPVEHGALLRGAVRWRRERRTMGIQRSARSGTPAP